MKHQRHVLKLLMIVGVVLFLAQSLYALDIDFQPRLETGKMSYAIKSDVNNTTILSRPGETSGHNSTETAIEFNDTIRIRREQYNPAAAAKPSQHRPQPLNLKF
jgi:hypothetical protein